MIVVITGYDRRTLELSSAPLNMKQNTASIEEQTLKSRLRPDLPPHRPTRRPGRLSCPPRNCDRYYLFDVWCVMCVLIEGCK